VTPAAQRRGALHAALSAVACAGLMVLWAEAPDRPQNRHLQSERSDATQVALAVSTSRLAGDPSSEAIAVDGRDPLGALIVDLGDADVNVRMDAVSDLGLSSDARVESLLASTAMQDPAPLVRIEALYALETLRAESQLAVFRHALADPDEDVRKAASSALEELGVLEELRTAR
jgi:hypothetical protein